ncbi:MAG TPA: 1,4-alpha-glucan branching protein domain-containing protein [Planctomycetota bacterium]|nr:1,4-alpha-glucan branching protein domain-containing protein [Planctomycetota bacterium]
MGKNGKGSFALVLHAHLPYVLSHGVWPHGTDWLNEATAECYIPLLNAFRRLAQDGISPKVTLNITPVLCEMLADAGFKEEFVGYCDQRVEFAEQNEKEFHDTGRPHLEYLARTWRAHFEGVRREFEDVYGRDLIGAFRRLQDDGHIELITCCATHGYLPLLGRDECVQAQVRTAVATHRRHFGREPRGIWLPECAYRPRYAWRSPLDKEGKTPAIERLGVEEVLHDAGIRFFFADAHLLKGGKPIGVYIDRFEALKRLWGQFSEHYEPRAEVTERSPHTTYVVCPDPSGERSTAIFVRDPRSALQVWSGEHGYPGDGWYLDFHKKHYPGGHRYWRVTDCKADLADKQQYDPARIEECLESHAGHFAGLVESILDADTQVQAGQGVVCAPFDAELFGHWWFEGPRWIEKIIRRLHQAQTVRLVTCSEYLATQPPGGVVGLPEGSWGEGGFHWIWLNDWTEWTWRHIYECEERFLALLAAHREGADATMGDLLRQAGRELLLLESSDWQFLISTWSARDYASNRVSVHYDDLKRLFGVIEAYADTQALPDEDRAFLTQLRQRDAVFPDLDLEAWSLECKKM